MDITLLLSFLFFTASGLLFMQWHLQMLQQNSYFKSRYFGWLWQSLSVLNLFQLLLFVIVFGLTFIASRVFLLPVAIVECAVGVMNFQVHRKNSIKKLVYTARVCRLLATAGLLSAILLVFYCVWPQWYRLWGTVIILFAHFPFLQMLAALELNQPLEKAITGHYLKQAKQLLRRQPDLKVIGITGSFGKTSVKTVLARMLQEKYNVLATPGNYNTPMGIVRTVREHLRPNTEILIAEMGAKNKGDIQELCEICHPQSGIITAVGPQHLDTFGSLENIQKTKFELADSCLKAGGKIYINADSAPAMEQAAKLNAPGQMITFGTDPKADCRVEKLTARQNGSCFTLHYGAHRLELVTKLLGRHNIVNIAGAAAMALDFGISEKQLRFAVSRLEQTEHRLQLKPFYNGATMIDDAYNANPVGCLEAVRVLGSFEQMQKIIVTPGLVELGAQEYDCNFKLGKAAAEVCDIIILVGEKRAVPLKDAIIQTSFDQSRLIVAKTLQEALEVLKTIADKNTVVLFENDLPDNYAG